MFTVDTRKQHCQISIAYCGANPAAGPIHASEITDRIYLPRDYPIAIIKATEHSDYSGSSVEASNYSCLQELSVREPGQWPLFEIYGSHGYQALAYDATLGPVPSSLELCEALDGFENGDCVFDDDHHSALEAELEGEAWESDGRQDFVEALDDVLDYVDPLFEHDGGDLADGGQRIPDVLRKALESMGVATAHPDDATWDEFYTWLWHIGCDVLNVNGGNGHVIETGCVVHFYIDEWVRGVRDMEHTNPSVQRGRFQLVLTELAKICRPESDGANEYPEGSGG